MGIRHGFSLRTGGVSVGPFASLNLHARVGDDPAAVAQNCAAVAAAVGFSLDTLCTVFQVHGNRTVFVSEKAEEDQQEADALVTDRALTLAVKYADCVPMLMADGQGRVAAVHAGWRGTVLDVAGNAVACLRDHGAALADLRVSVGPCIGPCCFVVQRDVAQQVESMGLAEVVIPEGPDQFRVDLPLANQRLLERAGVLPRNIEQLHACTACHPALFFSHRRDGSPSGRHMAFIQGGSRPVPTL